MNNTNEQGEDLENLLMLLRDIFNNSNITPEELEKRLIFLINHSLKAAESCYRRTSCSDQKGLPRVPTLGINKKYFKIAVVSPRNLGPKIQDNSINTDRILLDLLERANESVLKVRWKEKMLGNVKKAYKDHGDSYHTWILGYPRRGKFRQLKTGYVIISQSGTEMENERHQSSIKISVMKLNNKYYYVLTGFLTFPQDWYLLGPPDDPMVHHASIPSAFWSNQRPARNVVPVKDINRLSSLNPNCKGGNKVNLPRDKIDDFTYKVFENAWNFVRCILEEGI